MASSGVRSQFQKPYPFLQNFEPVFGKGKKLESYYNTTHDLYVEKQKWFLDGKKPS